MSKNNTTIDQNEGVSEDGGHGSTVTMEEFYDRLATLQEALASFDQILDDIALEIKKRQGCGVGSAAAASEIEILPKSDTAPTGKRHGKLQNEQMMEAPSAEIPSGSKSDHLVGLPKAGDSPVLPKPHKKRLQKRGAWDKLKKGKQYDVRDAHKRIRNATYVGSEAIGGLTLHCFQSGDSTYKFSETSLREFSVIVESGNE